jgi:hypothetical protein
MATVTKYTTSTAAASEIDRRTERFMAEKNCGYREAWHAVLAADKQLAEAYAQPAARVTAMATKPAAPVPATVPLAQGATPGETVHLRVTALREMDAGLTYQRAVNLVLAADPNLKAAYARS